jgi:acetyl-CoA decarbonylase/synthase complex subunit gamma
MQYKVQFAAVENESGDADSFVEAVKAVVANTKITPMLITADADAMKKAADLAEDKKPLLCCATEDNYEAMTEIAKEKGCPLVVKAEGLEALAELTKKVADLGHKQIVLDPGHREASQACADFVQIRRQCIKKKFRPLGYPIIAFTTAEDSFEEINEAVAYTSKYASVVVINSSKKSELLPLLSWRQNLYTDPQVPIQVEEKLYAVGEPDENSPVYITTNFSLTYYTVEGEIESSKIPAWVIPVATDGTSVLTAYAAGKYEPEKIAEVMKKVGVEEKVSHKNVVVPGLVAVVSGKLEEASGWKVLVGPREASGIPAYAKANFS